MGTEFATAPALSLSSKERRGPGVRGFEKYPQALSENAISPAYPTLFICFKQAPILPQREET
jgi:hypothetical protein